MSLTSVLRSDRPLSRRLTSLVSVATAPRPGQLPLVAPPQTKHYQLVGTAFDYLFRFEVQRRNPSAKTQDWVAANAVELLKPVDLGDSVAIREWPGVEDVEALSAEADGLLNEAKTAHKLYLGVRDPSQAQIAQMALHALRLAKLDVIFRAGIVDPSLRSADPLDVQDLVLLCKTIPFEGPMSVCLDNRVWLNPTFGRYSAGIQGADADVVASSTLIDIKTTINPDVRPHLAQVIGYAMLAEAYRSNEDPAFPLLESVGIYFARQGRLVSLPMKPVRESPDFLGAFGALMDHCKNEPLTIDDVRSMKTTGKPKDAPKDKSSRKRGP